MKINVSRFVLFTLVVSLFVAVFVLADVGSLVSPNVVNTTPNGFVYRTTSGLYTNNTQLNFANFSSNLIMVNISLKYNNSHGQYANVIFSWQLWGNASFMLNQTVSNITSNNTQQGYNSTFNTSMFNTNSLPEGIYNVSVYVENVTGALQTNGEQPYVNYTAALNVRIDRTAPAVSSIIVGNITDNAYLGAGVASVTGNYLLNVSAVINDSLLSTTKVYFNVTNSSGTVFSNSTNPGYFYIGNLSYNGLYTANGSLNANTAGANGNMSAAVNVSALAEGTYYISVVANDSLNNLNNTQKFTFTVDRTNPTVTVSCSPSNPTPGETVTCTCTASDTYGVASKAFTGGVTSESTTATGVGSFTSSVCTAVDNADNRNTATSTWSMAAASTQSGSGPGGTDKGVSTGVAGQFEKKTWTSINKGETATIVTKDAEIGVTSIQFGVSENVYGANVQVQRLVMLPMEVKSLDTKVYRYLKMSETNVGKALDGVAKVDFKVAKTWLAEQGLTKEDVSLMHYANGQWAALKTTFGEDDGTYVSYTAETPGFSYFAIAQGKATPTPVSEKQSTTKASESSSDSSTASGSGVSTTPESGAGNVQVMGGEGISSSAWLVAIVVLVVVIGVVWWALRSQKKRTPREEAHSKKK